MAVRMIMARDIGMKGNRNAYSINVSMYPQQIVRELLASLLGNTLLPGPAISVDPSMDFTAKNCTARYNSSPFSMQVSAKNVSYSGVQAFFRLVSSKKFCLLSFP